MLVFCCLRDPVCSWSVSWAKRAGPQLPLIERWAAPGALIRKACAPWTSAHRCGEREPWSAVPYHQKEQLGRYGTAFAQIQPGHVLFLVRGWVRPFLPWWDTCHTSLLWPVCQQGGAWPRWHELPTTGGAGGVCQRSAAIGWGAHPHCWTLPAFVGHRTRRVWGLLQCFCGVCEDVWSASFSAVYHGGGSYPRPQIQLGWDPLGSVQTPGARLVSRYDANLVNAQLFIFKTHWLSDSTKFCWYGPFFILNGISASNIHGEN